MRITDLAAMETEDGASNGGMITMLDVFNVLHSSPIFYPITQIYCRVPIINMYL